MLKEGAGGPSGGSDFTEKGLEMMLMDPTDGNSFWLYGSDGLPKEKYLDGSDLPTFSDKEYTVRSMDEYLFFFKVNADTEWHLYKFTPSTKTLVKIKEFDSVGSDPRFVIGGGIFANYNGVTLFAAEDSVNGRELWKTDGTAAGTVLVKDIFPGTDSGLSNFTDFVFFNDKIYFSAMNSTNDQEVWRTDGTTAGTVEISNINPDNGANYPHSYKIVGDYLVFYFSTSIAYGGLWQINQSEVITGPGAQKQLYGDCPVINGKVLFQFYDSDDFTSKIGVYNPADSSLSTLTDSHVLSVNGDVRPLGKVGSDVYFIKRDTGNITLHKTQGTNATTSLVSTIIGDGSATEMNAEMAFYDNGLIILHLDADNTSDANRVFKLQAGVLTEFTDDVITDLGLPADDYQIYFLSQQVFGPGAEGLFYHHNGEYKLMVMNTNTNYTTIAKTIDFVTYTVYKTADPSLAVDFPTQIEHYMAPLYGHFYYAYVGIDLNGSTYYLNDYFFPAFF